MQPQKRYYRTEQPQGAIAQLVEQRTENPCVPGSIPGGTTIDSVIKNPLNFKSSRDFLLPYFLHLQTPILWSYVVFYKSLYEHLFLLESNVQEVQW